MEKYLWLLVASVKTRRSAACALRCRSPARPPRDRGGHLTDSGRVGLAGTFYGPPSMVKYSDGACARSMAELKIQLPRSFPIAVVGASILCFLLAASTFAVDTYRAQLWHIGAYLLLTGLFAWVGKAINDTYEGSVALALAVAFSAVSIFFLVALSFYLVLQIGLPFG